MCIKLIKGNNIEYVYDILNIKVDKKSKSAVITDTTSSSVNISYKDEVLFNKLADALDCRMMNGTSIDVYTDENEFKKLLEEEEKSQRLPGQPPITIF